MAVLALAGVIAVIIHRRAWRALLFGLIGLPVGCILACAGTVVALPVFSASLDPYHAMRVFSDATSTGLIIATIALLCAAVGVPAIWIVPAPAAPPDRGNFRGLQASLTLCLVAAWGCSLIGIGFVRRVSNVGTVPAVNVPVHPAVQVGRAFEPHESLHYMGSKAGWFNSNPVPLSADDLAKWKRVAGALKATQTGKNAFTLRWERASPPITFEHGFSIEAFEERGNALFSHAIGDEWKFVLTEGHVQLGAKGKQKSLDRVERTIAIRIKSESESDGLHYLHLEMDEAGALQEHKLLLKEGETYLADGDKLVKLIEPVDATSAPLSSDQVACKFALQPWGLCGCSAHGGEEGKALPGPVLCRMVRPEKVSSGIHGGEMVADAMKLGMALFTIGLSTIDPKMRPTGKYSWRRVDEPAFVRELTQVGSRHGGGERQ